MGLFRLSAKDVYTCESGFPHLRRERYDQFNASVLGLGDLTARSKDVDAVAAVFDLAGFTQFCNQIDPQLAISEYLSAFIEWLFDQVKRQSVVVEHAEDGSETIGEAEDGTIRAFATLPFFAKFMGDGVLFLWDTAGLTEQAICSIPMIAIQICAGYAVEFLPTISFSVSDPPSELRCGIARGKVFSVGNGQDFVGPCINMASRLQKLSLISMAFSRRGFNADKHMDKHMRGHFVLKKVAVRGIGEGELVYVDRSDYERLPDEEKALFSEPDEEWRIPEEIEIAPG
jgi:class 3 adenylate cyclase